MIPLRNRVFGPAALSFPTWAYVVFFFIIPVAMVIFFSFGYKPDIYTAVATDTLSFDRFPEAMTPAFMSTFFATLRISLLGTFLCLLIALPFAYWIAVKIAPARRSLALALVMVPFWTNFLVRTLGWQIILSPTGFFSEGLLALGLTQERIDILYTHTAVQIGVVYNYLPLMILPLFVAIDRSGTKLREASYDLGANKVKTFFKVTLPMAMPGVISGCLLVFIPLNGDYITATVLGGASGSMIGQLIAEQFNSAQNWALGSAMAVVLIAATVIVVGVGFALLKIGQLIAAKANSIPISNGRV
ncbi:MAG: ABC transporter permease [Brevibacterium sp.]|uniref:ABC transporter permease n=1 Tax=Brevibacterium sp. TaxID=1701 RepID=UPI00264853AF|nr:ABC transporter permease [Brevibacterium sp.]MDN5808309.1 ABC transporter permease [Brevibacterium sp.]MDN5833934.1 ABC transporter permease [Brevibacterium sp.]MDN5876597.1 ABC transporter permease [Brevibacterium sp.]MDN5910480.1 ABC transporter permease [Brevibacterium sp.]MDN6132658.1 ABC transporter permease [Brevibacterium sp.]